MAELKPCPFCGSEAHLAKLIYRKPRPLYYGFCTNGHCQTQMVGRRSREKAIEAWNRRAEDGVEKCVNILHNAPTVDAVEVVHAHWEDGCAIHNGKEVYKSIDCSHCNEIFKTEDREYWKKRFKVCPFCGAIMDGERRTNEPEEPV